MRLAGCLLPGLYDIKLSVKTMVARVGVVLTTFLFNASFVLALVERIQDRQVKQGIRIANSFITTGMAAVL